MVIGVIIYIGYVGEKLKVELFKFASGNLPDSALFLYSI